MAEDKRNRGDQQQGGNQSQDRPRKERNPGMESPEKNPSRRQDEDESQE